MIWQPEFTDKTLSRKPGAVQNRLAEVVTRKLQDSFYINVSRDALNTAYSEHPEWFSGLVSGDEN
ncbi:hypothetical protein D8Z72_10035 [Escherichia coli]|nr:hypothetical protein D8Z72_10035 [Escherichia coli]